MNKKFTALTMGLLATVICVPCAAQFSKPEDAVKYRKGAFGVMAHHFGRLGAMLNDKMPYDAKLAASDAQTVALLAPLPFHGFGAGTGSPQAKPEIWSDPATFKGAGDKMVVEVQRLASAAQAGDLVAMKAAFGASAKTCKACHDQFKKD